MKECRQRSPGAYCAFQLRQPLRSANHSARMRPTKRHDSSLPPVDCRFRAGKQAGACLEGVSHVLCAACSVPSDTHRDAQKAVRVCHWSAAWRPDWDAVLRLHSPLRRLSRPAARERQQYFFSKARLSRGPDETGSNDTPAEARSPQ